MIDDDQNGLGKKWISIRILIFPAVLFLFGTIQAQIHEDAPAIARVPDSVLKSLVKRIRIFSEDINPDFQDFIIPYYDPDRIRTLILFDSLRLKASRMLIIRKLYDFVVVSPQPVEKKSITGISEMPYYEHRGKKIRSISVRRLNVFGSDINNPLSYDPKKIETLLNRTHLNTTETIIRKNLLFAEGDSISPLVLSDNERILRQLPYINDARILVVPVSDEESDIVVITKDIYSLGAQISLNGLEKGSAALYDKNIFGMGHEFGLEVPYDTKYYDSPGFGVHYSINNIKKSFLNLNLYYLGGLGKQTFGFDLKRSLVSSKTKYAFGISVKEMFTSEDLDSLPEPEPLKYNFQDYWFSRSFLLNEESVTRFILGVRYTNNNVFAKPFILPDSYYHLQKYRIYLASAALSFQKYYKTNLIYSYGRIEDIPYGGLLRFTMGKEINEFKERTYMGLDVSVGRSSRQLGYFYTTAGISGFITGRDTEQGLLSVNVKYFSNLVYLGNYRIRNFVKIDYTRGFSRYTDENLTFGNDNGFTGFRNDSITGRQRLYVSLESVVFSPVNLYGFRFALFGFTDLAFLSGTNQILGNGSVLSGLGLGIRIRNDNLVFNTLQLRLGFFPYLPVYSSVSNVNISGEQLLKPANFEPGPPAIIQYR